MTLAGMVALDEAALICDLAETYGIYDYRQLPPRTVAVLSVGLRENARIMKKLAGAEDVPELKVQLLAIIADRIVHAKPQDSIYNLLMHKEIKDVQSGDSRRIVGKAFDTPEEFMKARYGGGSDG